MKSTVLNAEMTSKGRGQYKVSFDLELNGEKIEMIFHSTDSQLYDQLTDCDTYAEKEQLLIELFDYKIEERECELIEE
jgi:hypothetical protein